MSLFPDLKSWRTSWTKYDIVQVIVLTMKGEIELYKSGQKQIDRPIFEAFLGIHNLEDPLPDYWNKIYAYPQQVGLFALIATLLTHYDNIERFNSYSIGNMQGVFLMSEGKQFTNLRSALVESGAAEKIYRRRAEVPYDLSRLYEVGEVGKLMKDLLVDRYVKAGYSREVATNNFFDISISNNIHGFFSLSQDQFQEWISGIGISNSLYELEKNGITYERFKRIPALKVRQWLQNWDQVPNYDSNNRRKPEPVFYQFNLPAILLKRIYDVHSRIASTNRKNEHFSQRKHSEERSREIREFVKGGFPWSTITLDQRETDTFKNLQMPGWLPTSIIANILSPGSWRRQKQIEEDAVITIEHIDDHRADIILPQRIWTDKWTPLVAPIEIIDGQHRIKAFDNISELNGQYELPVISYFNLDFTWQAYLFYTINIKPKRINTSLAYDLMPLLRIQDWLEQDLNGPDIYKKVRAQELTELLWKCPISPWYNRINMLGDTGEGKGGPVSQNAFINSLSVSFVKKWEGRIGGLFGGELTEGMQDVIQWDKETQAAFLILIWDSICTAIRLSKAEWAMALQNEKPPAYVKTEVEESLPLPFVHKHSFFTTDQGVRPILFIYNDLCFCANSFLELNQFVPDFDYEKYETSEIVEIIFERFKENKVIHSFINTISREIVDKFDWRTPSAFRMDIPEEDAKRQNQNQFRGSGGYREMRIQLLRALSTSEAVFTRGSESLSLSDLTRDVQTKLGL